MLKLIPTNYKSWTIGCCILIFLTTLFEVLGLSFIFPLLENILNSENNEKGKYITYLRSIINYDSNNELNIILLLIFLAFLSKFLMILLVMCLGVIDSILATFATL